MPRVMINGVVWCKKEDVILKTAVERHGENQWDLVASLLSGKTDRQCKARWTTWLDPSIKTIQWTREEKEKLMYLNKIMTNKRETTAAMIGRPTDECIGGYNYSWYEARRQTENPKEVNNPESIDFPRIELNCEAPRTTTLDSQENDENDPQILGQARARLANTQSKKSRRFTREKQIAVIRRLKHHQRMIEKKRSERNRIFNCNSENSINERTDSCFYDSSTKGTVNNNFSPFFARHPNDEYEKTSEKTKEIKRRRENDVAIDTLDDDETSTKRSKVLVVPVPQYSYNLHAFHDVHCTPDFQFTSNYHIFRQCDV